MARLTPAMLTLAALMPLAAASAASAQVVPQPAVLPVTGPVVSFAVTESVDAAPDMATVGTGVTTRALTAKEAMRLNAEAMDKVIAAILKSGIERKDVQTSGLNLSPQYDYNQQKEGQGPKFLGYEASNQLTVKIRKLETAGDIVDRMVQAGATNISGPTFGFADDSGLVRQARANAVRTATERATFYAQATGYRSARLLSLSENGDMPRPMPYVMMTRAMVQDAAPKTNVEPGQLSASVTLNLQFVLEK